MRIFKLTLILLIMPVLGFSLSQGQRKKLAFYERVINKLSRMAPRGDIEKIVLDRRVRFSQSLIMLNLDQPSVNAYISYSLARKALLVGKKFLDKHEKTLREVENRYSVDKEVIVAILYIETNFNPAKANYTVFNAYASLAFADHPYYLRLNLKRLRRKYRYISRQQYKLKERDFIANSKQRAQWAMKELVAVLKLAKLLNKPILDIKGSFAGAIGYPQFIPSSYLTYAADGNNDKYIDLFNIDDSIASIGNYLRSVGYKRGNIQSQKKAIHHYNRHWDYVRGVLEYAKRLKTFRYKQIKRRKR